MARKRWQRCEVRAYRGADNTRTSWGELRLQREDGKWYILLVVMEPERSRILGELHEKGLDHLVSETEMVLFATPTMVRLAGGDVKKAGDSREPQA
jgi:hypothetical protein